MSHTNTMLYHRTEPPRIVTAADELSALLADGWADTPAAFYEQAQPAESAAEKATTTTVRRGRPRKEQQS